MSSLLESISISDRVGAPSGLPRELILDTTPASINVSRKIVNVIPISANSIGPSQTLQIQLPQKGMMRAGSAYLRFKADITTAAGATWSFAGGSQSCGSLWNNVQLSAAGTVLESISNYHLWHNNVIQSHCLSQEALNTVGICEGGLTSTSWAQNQGYVETNSNGAGLLHSGGNAQFDTNFDTDLEFSMPLYLGLFHNKTNSAIPLMLVQGGLLLTLQSNPVSKAFFGSTSAAVSNYTLSNFEFCYEEIMPEESYISALRSGLSSGKLVKIEAESVLATQVGGNPVINQIFSLNMSSLDAICFGIVDAVDAVNTSKCFQAASNDAVWTTANRNQIRNEIYADGQLVFNSVNQLNIPAVQFRQLRLALSGVVAPVYDGQSICQGIGKLAGGSYNGSYINSFYLLALSMRKFVSDDTSFNGSRTNVVQITFTNAAVSSAMTYYFWFIYSYAMVIDASLSVSKVM